jgi:hypothetical protein
MVNKQIERVFKEPFLVTSGPSFNTNDSMLATGDVNGDVYIRNMLNPDSIQINSNLDIDPIHSHGI